MGKNFDLTLGIKPQALALLHSLVGVEETITDEAKAKNFDITTMALYNGRERGVVITVRAHPSASQVLAIFFSEERGSDQLFVQFEILDQPDINPPTIADFSEASYKGRKTFKEFDIKTARKVVLNLIQAHLDSWAVD